MKQPPSINRLLFVAASNFSTAEERRAFLEFACRGDEARLKRLEVLLEARGEAEEFFEFQPAVEPVQETPGEGEGGLGARIGPYRLIDRLGAGGCGVVYLAEQQEPVKRKVALKIIRLGMDTESVIARFAMEREALALMDHPNIARVLDAGTTASGRPFFAMELVDGERITDYCDRKRLDLRERLELFTRVCDAIQHAHQKGVIHRDIKPSNVLVRDHDGRAEPKVIDFGIAKATAGGFEGDVTYTKLGQLVGTPSYMSPEQAEGGTDIDTRSDIYSLGAMLCELLTGRPPFSPEQFKDRGPDEIRSILRDEETGMPSSRLRSVSKDEIGMIAEHRAADPQRLRAELAGDLDWIVMKAIEKDRGRRYETANGLAMDVQRYLAEEPVLARPPSRGYLLMKMVRRNRIAFAAGSVALFGLVVGFGTSTWLFLSEKSAREEQARLREVAERAKTVAEQARAEEVRLREKTQSADLVTQAAVLVRYSELARADALLAGLTPDRTPLSLEAADTLRAVADWNLLQGRWKTAAERFSALVPAITSVDMTDTDQMSRILLPAATAIKEWGEPDQYVRFRELAIRRFESSGNPAVAGQVIKAVLLEPADEETLEGVVTLATVLETSMHGPEMEGNPYLAAWRQFSLALVAYRRGNLDTAGYWSRRSSASPATTGSLRTSNGILLAMIDFKQGRLEDARTALLDAREQVAGWESTPFQLGTSVDLWFDWGNARIFLREAEEMIVGSED
ncbi:protein kinase [Luteolibacter flavescens]|uniref:Protein kinase n=1 Tax=Luteolibacter flavescens TaxID=1859460 RepID=A0ABT3FPD8_9BACT|nr:serine/threonine-protein kinase [Luteolibacter flavescens]MCW1885440.1 protein kinase [Luteolibacter flavescens]